MARYLSRERAAIVAGLLAPLAAVSAGRAFGTGSAARSGG
jgi:hypothetical protein